MLLKDRSRGVNVDTEQIEGGGSIRNFSGTQGMCVIIFSQAAVFLGGKRKTFVPF